MPYDVMALFATEYDLPSLLAWRSTSSTHRVHGSLLLERTRDQIVEHFVGREDTMWLLNVLAHHRAVITGDAALAFMLRDLSVVGDTLHIAVDRVQGAELEEDLERWFRAVNVTPLPAVGQPQPGPYEPTVHRFSLPNSTKIIISTSPNESAITCVATGISTAYMNFLTRDSFGCAYPLLTLQRWAIAPRTDIDDRHSEERARLRTLEDHHGFRSHEHAVPLVPRQFLIGLGEYDPRASHYPCLRHWYICPGQARFFGDAGSLVGFFNAREDSQDELSETGQAPFGPAVVWRLRWSVGCARGCWARNRTLRHFATGWLSIDHEPFTYSTGYVGLRIAHVVYW